MLDPYIVWASVAFDALGILASVIAVIVHVVVLRSVMRCLPTDTFGIPVAVFRRWLVVNAWFAGLVGALMLRWFVLHDLNRLDGLPSEATGPLDDLLWAMADLLLVIMPVLLIANLRAVVRSNHDG